MHLSCFLALLHDYTQLLDRGAGLMRATLRDDNNLSRARLLIRMIQCTVIREVQMTSLDRSVRRLIG